MKNDKKRVRPIIVPKRISDWIKQETPIIPVNNYKKGGGLPGWNSSK